VETQRIANSHAYLAAIVRLCMVARRSRNLVIRILILICVAVIVLSPHSGPDHRYRIGDVTTIDAAAILRTLHTYPLVFTNVVHTRRGHESRPLTADPRRGDLLRPAD
jgi:hypothetical protein